MPRHSRPYLQGEHAAVELAELDGGPAAHPGRASASYHPHAANHGPAAHSVHAFRTPAHGDDSSYDHGSEQLVEPTSVAASNLHTKPNPYPSPHPYPHPHPYPATPYNPITTLTLTLSQSRMRRVRVEPVPLPPSRMGAPPAYYSGDEGGPRGDITFRF